MILYQLVKFSAVGILNTIIDLGVLNILIWLSGIAGGLAYSVFKGVSFTAALVNSFFFNKFWTFKKKERIKPGGEFIRFFAVALLGLLINVGIASLVVNLIGPQFGLSIKIWANLAAIIATLAGITWNFLGYKFWVFKI